MRHYPILTVMLTHNDLTVRNAYEIFDTCKNSLAEFWGFKEEPLEINEMKEIFGYMKRCNKKTVLEVVSYDEEHSLAGAEMAVQCGCDYLMGTVYSDTVNAFCKTHSLKYLPFVGNVSERPSILEGDVESMITEATEYLSKGVFGIDLLGYRYTGNASHLIEHFVNKISAPVCIAGSINSIHRVDEIKRIQPWAFTIGSAFFENRFGESFSEQINRICKYMNNTEKVCAGI